MKAIAMSNRVIAYTREFPVLTYAVVFAGGQGRLSLAVALAVVIPVLITVLLLRRFRVVRFVLLKLGYIDV